MEIREINPSNAARVKKGANISANGKSGKVVLKEVIETFGFILYQFHLHTGEQIKIIKSTI